MNSGEREVIARLRKLVLGEREMVVETDKLEKHVDFDINSVFQKEKRQKQFGISESVSSIDCYQPRQLHQ